MTPKILFFVFTFIFIYSCKNKQKHQENNIIHMDVFPFAKNDINHIQQINLSEIYSKISGFPIDLKGGPLGHVSKVLIFEDILFAFDSHYAKKIFAYDLKNKGRFIYSIGKKGKGPGEFIRLVDFSIDSLNRQILTADIAQRNLSWFDLDGNYLYSKTLDFNPAKFYCDSKYIYFKKDAEQNEFGVIVLDKRLNTVANHLPFSHYPSFTNFDMAFQQVGNKILLNYPSCDTIFHLNGPELIPYLAINSEKYSIYSCVKRNNLKNRFEMGKFFSAYIDPPYLDVILPEIYFEDNKIKLFHFFFNQMPYKFVKIKIYDDPPVLGRLINDFFNSYIALVGHDKKYGTIGIIDTQNMLHANVNMAKEKKQLISEELMHSIQNPDPNSNPFIIFLK